MRRPNMAASESGGWANPAVIGLMGFGMTTMVTGWSNVASLNVGFIPVLGMALVFGGTAQFIAGLVALRGGNIFAGSAFVGYGSFWVALFAMLTIVPKYGFTFSPHDLLAFWILWTLFTLTFTISAPKHGLGVSLVFIFLLIAFILLSVEQAMIAYNVSADTIKNFATGMGWEIFFDGFLAWLTATAIVTNANYGRKIIPL